MRTLTRARITGSLKVPRRAEAPMSAVGRMPAMPKSSAPACFCPSSADRANSSFCADKPPSGRSL
jgi:hypothetical protein